MLQLLPVVVMAEMPKAEPFQGKIRWVPTI